ncbi:MAG: TetR family transcriptional regulator [Gammaproteobacteria bacterium]|nr:TetR family transcriptional regulator [Gammaproteobacteria bacterium]
MGLLIQSNFDPKEQQINISITGNKRQRLKQQNQLTLIKAALDCIAELGVRQTSVSEIIQRAGLSRGMIHLHFGGKDQLLIAAGHYASKLYYDHLETQLLGVNDCPQKIIEAVVRSDLSPAVLNQHNVNIWYAFRGEARHFKDIVSFSDTRDPRLRKLVSNAYQRLAIQNEALQPEQARALAKEATYGTLCLMEGMWTDYLLHTDSFDRHKALRIIMRFQAALFPAYFNLDGAIPTKDE